MTSTQNVIECDRCDLPALRVVGNTLQIWHRHGKAWHQTTIELDTITALLAKGAAVALR